MAEWYCLRYPIANEYVQKGSTFESIILNYEIIHDCLCNIFHVPLHNLFKYNLSKSINFVERIETEFILLIINNF